MTAVKQNDSSSTNGRNESTSPLPTAEDDLPTETKTLSSTTSPSILAEQEADGQSTNDITVSTTPQTLQRYKMIVSYDGTRYSGFQRQSTTTISSLTTNPVVEEAQQPAEDNGHSKRKKKKRQFNNSIVHQGTKYKKRRHDEMGRLQNIPYTIQESIEDAVEMYTGLNRQDLRLRFAGRTDAGVHARGQVIVVSLPKDKDNSLTCDWQIRKSINSRLPLDISIDHVTMCDESFDPKKDTISKQYSYTIRYRRKILSDENDGYDNKFTDVFEKGGPPLLRTGLDSNRIWICPWSLDDTKFIEYCRLLTGTHDYSAFVHKHVRNHRDNYRTITKFECHKLQTIKKDETPINDVQFIVESKGFGRSQVRNMIGFIVDLCRGGNTIQNQDTIEDWLWTLPPDKVSEQINAAPACGLCLEKVNYNDYNDDD